MMALVPGMPLLWMMAGALFVVGVCQGFIDVGGNTLMVWLHGERSGPPMNALHFFWGVGAFLMPLVVAQVALLTNQVNAAYIALAVLMLPAALWLLRLPSPSAPAAASGVAGKASLRSDVLLVSMIMAFFLLYTGAEVSVGGWVYTYAVTLWPAAKVTAALITSGFWGALTVGRLLAIPLATRLSPEKMILIDLSGALISLALIVLFPGVQMALWVGVIGVGLFLASIFPTMLAFAGQRMAVTGKTTGWFLVGANLGAMSLPWLVGQLFAPVGPRVVFWIVLIAVALEFGLFLTILARTRKHG
jgi:FHS family Na+ dependent glucose MFS transporter 1